jgi:hypothetical protein
MKPTSNQDLFHRIAELIQSSKSKIAREINQTIVYTYYEIGRYIVEDEQNGKERATYSKEVLKNLSERLGEVFGKGYSTTNLENMRKFYLAYSKSQTVSGEFNNWFLSWSHYTFLMRLNEPERQLSIKN